MGGMNKNTKQNLINSLKNRDGHSFCRICGGQIKGAVTIDHIIPKNLGGPSFRWNLMLAHDTCNVKKGAVLNRKNWADIAKNVSRSEPDFLKAVRDAHYIHKTYFVPAIKAKKKNRVAYI